MTWRYVLALGALAILTIVAYVGLERAVTAQANIASVINVAGRQRMLTLRIAVYAERYVAGTEPSLRKILKEGLAQDAERLIHSHEALIHEAAELGLSQTLSPAVRALYFGPEIHLDEQLREYLAHVDAILRAPEDALRSSNEDLAFIRSTSSPGLVDALDAVVHAYEDDDAQKIAHLRELSQSMLVVTLAMLVALGLFVFHPMVRDASNERRELLQSKQKLHTVVANAPIVVFSFDAKGDLLLSEGKGLASSDDGRPLRAAGNNLFALYADTPEIIENVERALRGEAFTTVESVRGVTFETTYSPVKGASGETLEVVGVSTNVTERKKAEEASREAKERLANWVTQLERRNREILALSEMGGMLLSCEGVAEAKDILPHYLSKIFPRTEGALFSLNPAANLLDVTASWGSATLHDLFGPDDCWALRRGRPHRSDGRSGTPQCRHLASRHNTLTTCVPMMARGEALGVLVLEQDEASATSSPVDETLAVNVAEQLSLAVANLRLREALHSASIRDALTGLFNRRYLEETLERELSRAERQAQPLGLMVIDLDRFKALNDTFGHQAGDEALKAVGKLLRSKMRHEDVACRFGGEEFVIVAPGASLMATKERAERLREELRSLNVMHRDQSLGMITASFGVAAMPDHGITSSSLIRAADAAVYRAKYEGRDRVVIANRSMVAESGKWIVSPTPLPPPPNI